MTNSQRAHGLYHVALEARRGDEAPLGPHAAPAVIGLHGLSCSGRLLRRALAPLSAGGARVLLPDLLGHGRSPWPAGIAYGTADHVAALRAFTARHAGAEPFWIVGCSLGALLAIAWAAEEPQSVLGVVAVSAPIFSSEGEARRILAEGSAMARLMLEAPTWAERLCRTICGPSGRAARLCDAALARELAARLVAAGLGTRAASVGHMLESSELLPAIGECVADAWLHSYASIDGALRRCIVERRVEQDLARLRSAGVPLLFVHGAGDALAPARHADQAARGYGFSYVGFDDASHALALTHAPALARVTARFLGASARFGNARAALEVGDALL